MRTILPADGDGAAVYELTRDEGMEMFGRRCQESLGISGEEFLRRYDAHEYDCAGGECAKAHHLIMLIPFARP
jgi:hypothetical protein